MRSFYKNVTAYMRRLFPKSVLPVPDDWKSLVHARRRAAELFCEDRYISRSDVASVCRPCSAALDRFRSLSDLSLLEEYCAKHGIAPEKAVSTLAFFDRIDSYARARNRRYVDGKLLSEKDYFDHILDSVDPSILLDEDQRRMIVNDEDYCLVIAGAGAGKTTAVAAKVKYLTEKRGIDPQEILVISFTNKAVAELKDRIQKNLRIPCPIATFHSTGNAILHRHDPQKINIADPSLKYTSILAYFQRHVLRDEAMVHKLLLFFSYYMDPPFDTSNPEAFFRNVTLQNYDTLKSQLGEIHEVVLNRRNQKPVTICNEILRSRQEVQIANFLYLNGIPYEYEPEYPFDLPGSRKPYTPDFSFSQNGHVWYLEHFGLSEDGDNDRYSPQELERYKAVVRSKVLFHRRHGTDLIYTFSSYRDGRPLLDHLREELLKRGIGLHPLSEKEILSKLVSREEARSVSRLVLLLSRFISGFKTDGYTLEQFDILYEKQDNVRARLFLDIARACYLEYERVLQEKEALDFEDMINDSAAILRREAEENQASKTYSAENQAVKIHSAETVSENTDSGLTTFKKDASKKSAAPDFKYIIVDEYQDISRQRFDLVRALRDATGAKIIAVGDDWQSIYAFSGSDISLFTKFREKMGYASLLRIEHTYRNAQEVIDIAGGFIQKNSAQLKKSLKSSKNIPDPIIILTCDSPPQSFRTRGDTWFERVAETFEKALDEIAVYHKGKTDGLSVLVLGRFNFDGYNLSRSDRFTFKDYGSRILSRKYPRMRITFMTAHSSKGLGYDEVILLNAKDDRYGFPAKIEEDPLLSMVLKDDTSYDYAEERRLFYVAMTRTKNRVWMIAPSEHPSEFLLELLRDYDNVKLEGNLVRGSASSGRSSRRCPVCGFPLKLRFNKAYGMPLYICSNEPEVCGFLTNDLAGGRMGILRCDCCRDGYLIVRRNRKTGEMFWGCTNYLPGGKGCNRTISGPELRNVTAPSAVPEPSEQR